MYISLFSFYVYGCFACIFACVATAHLVPEEGIMSSGTGAPEGCKPPCGQWKSNLGPLEEPLALLTAEPSVCVQPDTFFFFFNTSNKQLWFHSSGPSHGVILQWAVYPGESPDGYLRRADQMLKTREVGNHADG